MHFYLSPHTLNGEKKQGKKYIKEIRNNPRNLLNTNHMAECWYFVIYHPCKKLKEKQE